MLVYTRSYFNTFHKRRLAPKLAKNLT